MMSRVSTRQGVMLGVLGLLAVGFVLWLMRGSPAERVTPGSGGVEVVTEETPEPKLVGHASGAPIQDPPAPDPSQASIDREAFAYGTLHLTVVDPEGNPVPRGQVSVRWWPQDQRSPVMVLDSQTNTLVPSRGEPKQVGTYALKDGLARVPRVEGLPNLSLEITPFGTPAGPSDELGDTRTDLLRREAPYKDMPGEGDAKHRVALERGMMISGRVLQHDGQPADFALLRFEEERSPNTQLQIVRDDLVFHADAQGRFVLGRLPRAHYGLVATWHQGRARVYVEGAGQHDGDITLGTVEGPFLRIIKEDDVPTLARWSVRGVPPLGPEGPQASEGVVLSVLIAEPPAPTGDAIVFLPRAAVGVDGEIRAHVPDAHGIRMDFTWRVRIGPGETRIRVPAMASARVQIAGVGGKPATTPVSVIADSLLHDADPSAPKISITTSIAGGAAELRIPSGRYTFGLLSSSTTHSSARQSEPIVVPGVVALALEPRRSLRIRISGAEDIASLTFVVDGTKPAGSRWRLEGDTVVFDGVDAGTRKVYAWWRGFDSRGNLRSRGASTETVAVRKQIGVLSVEGEEGTLQIRQGSSLVFKPGESVLPLVSTSKSRDVRSLFQLTIHDAGNRVYAHTNCRALAGPYLGYPQGTVVSPPMLDVPSDCSVFVSPIFGGSLPHELAPNVPDAWVFRSVRPSSEPILLEAKSE